MTKMWQQLIVLIIAFFVVIHHGIQAEVQIAAPSNMTVYNKTGDSLFVQWSEVQGEILGYRVRHQRNDTPVALGKNGTLSNNSSIFVCKNVMAVKIEELEVYTDYHVEVRAFNNATFGPNATIAVFRTDEGVPTSPPVNVRAKADEKNATLISVHWGQVPLADRRGEISFYSVTVIEHEGEEIIHELNVTGFNATISGLKPYTFYNVTVAAWTSKGASNASEKKQVRTAEAAPWDPPTHVNMSYDPFMLNDIFNFTWEPVQGRLNGILRGYKVRWKQVKSSNDYIRNIINSTTNSASNRRRRRSASYIIREIRLTNLSLYTNYSFEVAAITVAVGKFSDKYYFMSQEGVPTAPPGNVRSYNTSSRSIFVSWTRPNKSEIHGVLKGYEISYTPADNANATRKVMLCHLNTSYELTRLRIFTLYNITVAAFTIKGIGNESQLLQVYTAEEAPQAPPENVTAVAVNGSSIRVSWGPVPKDKRNGIITRYRVQFGSRTLKNVTNGTRQVRGTQNSVVIGDLEMFVTYSFRVQARTKIGRGNFSEPVNQTTTQTVPNIILHLDGTPSNSSINVTWKVIDKPFGLYTPNKYEIKSCTVNDSCQSGSCLTNITSKNWYEFTNLRGGTTHKFRVRPVELSARDGTVLTYPEGNFSEQINVTTKEGAPTRSPLNVTAIPHSQSSIQITWDEVNPCHRNGKITGYNLEVYNSSGHGIQAIDFNDTTPRVGIVKNLVFANYSVRVRAFTAAGNGPFSQSKNTTTHEPAPNFVPQILRVTATGNTTINVKWNCTGIPPGDFAGYSVWYKSTTDPELKDVGRQPCETNLTELEPFTDYTIRVAARTTQPGNYSKERSAKTLEGVPEKEPEVEVEILESSSVSITWKPIPERFRNGIIKGYHIEYHPEDENKSAVLKENLPNENFTSHILTSLRKFTTYTIKVAAYTKAGIGPLSSKTFKTSDDFPSAAPINLTAINSVSPHEIKVTWKPVPEEYMNGDLVDYQVTYQRVKIGGVPIDFEPVGSVSTDKNSLTLKNLDPYSEYEITVAASTGRGLGPRTSASYGETCHCEQNFTTSWRRYEPYVNFTEDNEPGEIIPVVLRSMVRECCGKCQSYGEVKLDFKRNGRSNTSERHSYMDLLQNLDETTDFTFPVSGYKEQDSYKGGYGFAPIIESAGVAFIVYPDTTQNQNTMYQSVLLCLPVMSLPIVLAYIAGVIIWCLERRQNPQDFPPSFLLGTWEGIWWSFVSMTTLGYGDRAPLSHKGRSFAMLWTLTGLVIISLTMAMITTALTSITLQSKIKLYGSKVAAEFNSPEYNVATRRNAKIDPGKEYKGVDDITEALLNREVEGILVDTYSAGLRSDLFNRPGLQVNEILDYKTAYGVVLSPNVTQLGKCFERYLTSHRAEIFEMIKRKAKPIETSGAKETSEEEASGGLLDSGSPTFLKALKYACVSLGIALVLSLIYECIRCIRARRKVHQKESHKAKLQEEMQTLVEEFNQRVLEVKMKLREKHIRQIIKYWKLQKKSMCSAGMEHEWLRISTASPHNGELTISEI